MKTVYVTHTVLASARFCLVVEDDADLKRQLEQREQALRAQPFVTKVERDKKGDLVMRDLSSDWDSFKPKDWDPTAKV